jgi:hypothetical protein
MAPVDGEDGKQFLPMNMAAEAAIDPEGSESCRSRQEHTSWLTSSTIM